MGSDLKLVIVCGVLGAAVVFIGITATRADFRQHERLMAQCRADGHKEYECVSLLETHSRDNSSIILINP